MSLVIKNMEMPQAGDVIICGQIDGKLQCTIVTRGKPTKWCEVSEISAPHGDLIDKEPIKEFISDGINKPSPESYGYDGIEILSEIEFAPVIIEAEVSE